MSRHAILASIGTDGDVYPFLSLGLELRRRGYRVTLATHDHFASQANAGGLSFEPLVSAAETEQLLVQRDFWHPLKSALVLSRWGARMIPRQYRTLSQLSSGERAFLVTSPGILAARVLQEHSQIPLVSVLLQPGLIPSVEAPPVLMGGVALPHWAPRAAGRLYFRLLDEIGVRLIGSELRQLRASLGLPPLRRIFRWWLSPDLTLGLFADWFGPPQPDWPEQIRLTGFPLETGRQGASLPANLAEFCRAGKPVLAFTFGTGMLHGAELFREALEACRLLGARAALLTTFRAQLPPSLPDFACHCEYAPFQELFPLCAAVVHHGGIGTVAKSLAAGTPQLILPLAYDQLDNAIRVKKLGAGNWLKRNQRAAGPMASALGALLTPESTASARSVARRFAGPGGIVAAADHVEEFVRGQD